MLEFTHSREFRQLDSVSNCANLFADKVNESQEKLSRLSENTAILRGQIAEFEVTLANSLQARKEAERRCQKAEASADSWRLECELLSSRIDEGARAYADLAGVKVQLDEEIAMYRVLLQSEEER
ncbi:unnamed protein product [Protopolystoma xenopodis]|uniref:IF rod domain-containing protein n=1 Tax=Protopolystoma xenopodis TaxID=117903 RepID=A0A3S5B6B6_9PLAT|nr:unnamed protein product [Protopolystoma xenopodis]